MYSKVVNVAATSGTQDITFTPNGSDPSWTPKIAIVQWNSACTSTSSWIEHKAYGIGWTNGTAQRCICTASEDNQARGDTGTFQSNNSFITALTASGTVPSVDAVATFSSWLSNGIQITWSDAPGAGFYLTILFLGGSDITNVDVGTLMTGTGTSPISVSSLSYQPDFGIFMTGATTTENSGVSTGFLSLGAATSSSAQWVQSTYELDNPLTMSTRQYYSHGKVVVSNTTSVTGYATFTTFDSNGFTLTPTDAFPSSFPIYYLVIKGGSFVVGNGTEPGGTGNQTVTTNKDVKAVAMFGLDLGTADTVSNGCMWSGGFADNGINQYGHVWEDTHGTADSVVVSALDGASHIYNNITANATVGSTTWDDSAIIYSVSSTNFIINWDNIGQARPYRYVSFGTKASETFQRSISETTISVSSTLVPKRKRPLAQTITNSDSIGIGITRGRTVSDTLTNSDSITTIFSFVRALAETITNSDSVDIVHTLGLKQRSVADTITNSDSIVKLKKIFRTLADTITNSDIVARKILLSISDTITNSDSITPIVSFVRSVSDTITNSDSVGSMKLLLIAVSDTITNSDSMTKLGTYYRSLSDTISNSEILGRLKLFLRYIWE